MSANVAGAAGVVADIEESTYGRLDVRLALAAVPDAHRQADSLAPQPRQHGVPAEIGDLGRADIAFSGFDVLGLFGEHVNELLVDSLLQRSDLPGFGIRPTPGADEQHLFSLRGHLRVEDRRVNRVE